MVNIFIIITLNFLLGRLYGSLYSALFQRLPLVPSSGTYSSVSSFHPVLRVYFYLIGRLCFLILEKRPCVGKIPWGPVSCFPLITRASGPPMWAVYALLGVVRLTTVGVLIGRAHPHFGWLRGLALYGGCLAHCISE